MKRRSAVLMAAVAAGGAGLAGAAAVARTRAYLRRERDRHDPAAGEDFSVLADLKHHTIPTYDNGELHLIERGPAGAQPLLFIHGVTLSSEVWKYQLRDLAGQYRVIALDQRGHGKSRAGLDGFGLDRLSRDVATVLEALDLRDVVIIGHSMGGFATQRFCIDHPPMVAERVAGIVLMHTACAKLMPFQKYLLPVAHRVTSRVTAPRNTPADAAFLGTRFALGQHALPSHVRFTYELSAATDIETTVESVLAFLDLDLRDGLRQLKVPALVIGGTHDRLLPPGHAQRLAANLPGARLVMLAGCGHMGMLERHEEVARLIDELAGEVGARAA